MRYIIPRFTYLLYLVCASDSVSAGLCRGHCIASHVAPFCTVPCRLSVRLSNVELQ